MDDFDHSPFQHISKDYIYHTHRLLIIMAKTNRTNPHSEEPTRRSNRTAGKSPASVVLPARKTAAARKATAASPSHDFDDEGGCNNQLGRLKVGILSNKKALSLLLQPDSGLLFRSFSSEVKWQ